MSGNVNPWLEQAGYLMPDSVIGREDRARAISRYAAALAWAYEQGYAQGRLYEIERARAPVELAGDDHAK